MFSGGSLQGDHRIAATATGMLRRRASKSSNSSPSLQQCLIPHDVLCRPRPQPRIEILEPAVVGLHEFRDGLNGCNELLGTEMSVQRRQLTRLGRTLPLDGKSIYPTTKLDSFRHLTISEPSLV